MVRHRTTWHILATMFAAGAAGLCVAGCDSAASVDTGPRTAASAGREVFGGDSAAEANPEAKQTDHATATSASATPVIASKPDGGAPREIAFASAKIVSADEGATNAAASVPDAVPRLAAPPADASKYPGGIIPASANAQPLPGGPRLLVPHKTFRPEGNPPALRVSYDDLDLLKVLNIDPVPPDVVEQFPSWLKELDGKRVRIRGFMYPSFEEMLSAFVLTRDTGVCCFGPNPKVYYLIGVKLQEGTKVRYVQNRPVDVVGTFHIQPVESDGQWFQLYKISDAAVVE
jgi:hypothetical protein